MNLITIDLIEEENERNLFRSQPGKTKWLQDPGTKVVKVKTDDYIIDLTKLHGSNKKGADSRSIDTMSMSRNGYKWEEIVNKNNRLALEGHLLNHRSPRSVLVVLESLMDNEFLESAEVRSSRVFGEVDDEVHLNS